MATIITRSGKGLPLTNTEVDNNFTNLNTDKVEKSGDSMTGNLSFGDNDKAIFGADSDLQIYHTGSHSWVQDAGTGNLYVAGDHLWLTNSDNTKQFLKGDSGGTTSLYYNTGVKLATTSTGIDVTGTVTADGLTVAGDAEVVGSTTATNMSDPMLRVSGSSYTASGTYGLGFHYTDDATGVTPTYIGYKLNSGSGNTNGHLVFGTRELTTQGSVPLERMRIGHNGDISFYEDTGTTPKFFWDASAESLGIGTTSPVINNNGKTMHIHADSGEWSLFHATTGESGAGGGDGTIIGQIGLDGYLFNYEAGNLIFGTSAAERMRIDSSGNLLVGRTSPISSEKFGVEGNTYLGATTGTTTTTIRNGNSSGLNLYVTHSGGANTSVSMQMETGDTSNHGHKFIKFTAGGSEQGSISANSGAIAYNTSSDYRLKTDVQPMTDATERLKALKPVNFEWISTGTRVDGFLAHEAQEVVPEAVTGTKDAMRTEEYEVTPAVLDDDGNVVTEAVMGEREVPDYQGIDQSKMTPLVVKCLQEAIERIEQLESRLAAAGIE